MLRFAEELLVLMTGAENRAPISVQAINVPERTLAHALAGAVLMDLALENRIDTDLDALHVTDPAPVGDSLLDPVLDEIVRETSTFSTEAWIRRFAQRYDEFRALALDRLVAANILESDDGGVFSLSPKVSHSQYYPAIDGVAEREITARMVALLFSDDIPSPRDSMIVSLAHACGVFRCILARTEYEAVKDRIELISGLELVARSVTSSVHNISIAESQRLQRIVREQRGNWPKASGALPMIGHSFKLAGDLRGFFAEQYLKHGPVFEINGLGRKYVVLAGQEANLFTNREDRRHFRSLEVWDGFRQLMGSGSILPGSDGAEHLLLRKAKRNGYSRGFFLDRMPEAVSAVERELTKLPFDRPLSVVPIMQRLMAEQISLLAAGTSSRDYFDDIVTLSNVMHFVFLAGIYPKFILKMPRFRRACRRLESLIERVLTNHEAKPDSADSRDLVDDLIELHRSAPDRLPETDMFIATMGPFMVGLDTVAPTTSFALYALLKHPDLLDQVQAEADELFSTGDPTPEGIHRMTTTRNVIMETLRMYSIAPALPRMVTNTFEFAGYHIPAGTKVLIALTVTHKLPEFFPNPERFDIDRYSPKRREHTQPGVFAPFGLGHHGCLGRGFSEVQMALTLAALLHRVEIVLDPPNYSLKTKPLPSPRPDAKFKVRLRPRQ